MKIIYTFIICFLISFSANAQSFISFSTGISTDVNHKNKPFYQIPFSLQWKPFADKKTPLIFELDYDIPFKTKSTGDAYTLNPNLPEKVTLWENITPYIFTGSIGFRIHLFTNKKNNSFYLNIFPIGICNQNSKVVYKNYDRENYEVINPDVNTSETKLVMSMAAVYNFHKTKQDMMLMLHLQSPLLKGKEDYLLSYKSIAPLQLTFGYNFYYNKRK